MKCGEGGFLWKYGRMHAFHREGVKKFATLARDRFTGCVISSLALRHGAASQPNRQVGRAEARKIEG